MTQCRKGAKVGKTWNGGADASRRKPLQWGRNMFNSKARKEAIRKLEIAVERHESVRNNVAQASELLFAQRQRSVEAVGAVEEYVNMLANSPQEFDKTIAETRIEADRFKGVVKRFKVEAARAARIGGSTGAAGAAAGAGVAAFAPSAAMAIATTFGTASTGTAISALSGAAATNAALAWLGGGALAAGGSGMAGGAALLALAGPVGWTVGGAALVGSGIYLNSRNKRHSEEATEKRMEVEAQIRSLKAAVQEIQELQRIIKAHSEGVLNELNWLQNHALPKRRRFNWLRSMVDKLFAHAPYDPNDYQRFSQEQKLRLAALINHVRSLGALLNKEVVL